MSKSENLMVRVDWPSKSVIARAARLRGISASDYVRSVVVSQARRELEESRCEADAAVSAVGGPRGHEAERREVARLSCCAAT